jgi:pyrimidine deaminase RibD-like protein
MKFDVEEILDLARKTAAKSTMRFKVSCILIDNKGKVVATGFNHRAYGGKRLGNHSVHAEVCAIKLYKIEKTI